MEILTSLNHADADSVKRIFIDFVKEYLTPSYGSMSKKDFEILLFMKLQEIGAIDKEPDLYRLIKELKISRNRARNLLYEAKMRSSNDEDLNEELIELLQTPIFLKDGDKVGIEIQNPFLADHFRFKLKELGHITDGSFSPELVKLNYLAYIDLVDLMVSTEFKNRTVDLFIQEGIMEDASFKAVFTGVIKKLGHKFAGKAGELATENVLEYLSPIFTGAVCSIREKTLQLFIDEI